MDGSDSEFHSVRGELIRGGEELIDEARALEAVGDLAGQRVAIDRSLTLQRKYTEMLPTVAVARCPETDAIVQYAIDTGDLDGWFWDYDNPRRRHVDLPTSWLTMCGALLLREPVAAAPFTCEPGPGVPYVIPRMLSEEGVLAVINQIPVGPHIGWAISYFGPRRTGTKLENIWGANTYDVYADDGTWLGLNDNDSPRAEFDFDLTPWLESGKLLWIAPGDPDVQLHSGAVDCPYTGIEGKQRKTSIFRGEVRRYG